jgi:hypothetical protein
MVLKASGRRTESEPLSSVSSPGDSLAMQDLPTRSFNSARNLCAVAHITVSLVAGRRIAQGTRTAWLSSKEKQNRAQTQRRASATVSSAPVFISGRKAPGCPANPFSA